MIKLHYMKWQFCQYLALTRKRSDYPGKHDYCYNLRNISNELILCFPTILMFPRTVWIISLNLML